LEDNPPKKRGCLFYGCLAVIIFSLAASLLAYLGYRSLRNSLARFLDTTPVPIETVEISPAERDGLQQRLAAFKEAMDGQKIPRELTLTARDLNALIADQVPEWKGKVFAMIDNGRIKGRISLPLENFGPFKLKGKYLNGAATFKASLEAGTLNVTIEQVEVKGQPLPAWILSKVRAQNLAQGLPSDPGRAQTIQKLESLRVVNDVVVLKNRIKE
jgi:hypothetical protein